MGTRVVVARHDVPLGRWLLGLGLGRRRRGGRQVLIAAPPARRIGLVWWKLELAVGALGVRDLVVVLDLDRSLGRLVLFLALGVLLTRDALLLALEL
jgi:hypothetical protein